MHEGRIKVNGIGKVVQAIEILFVNVEEGIVRKEGKK